MISLNPIIQEFLKGQVDQMSPGLLGYFFADWKLVVILNKSDDHIKFNEEDS